MKCGVQIAGTNLREEKALEIFRMAFEKRLVTLRASVRMELSTTMERGDRRE